MGDIEVVHEGPPELVKQIPPEIRQKIEEDIRSLTRDQQRFETTFWTSISLMIAKYGLSAVSATLSTLSGYGALLTGGAAVGFGLKYLVESLRQRRKEYVVQEPPGVGNEARKRSVK